MTHVVPCGRNRRPDAGVTLVEMLVVLAILGTAVGAAMLAIPQKTDDPSAMREAQLLQTRLVTALDTSMATLRPARMVWEADGYAFEEWDGSEWRSHLSPVLSERHILPGSVTLEDTGTLAISPDVLPPKGGTIELVLRGASRVRLRYDGFAATLETGS